MTEENEFTRFFLEDLNSDSLFQRLELFADRFNGFCAFSAVPEVQKISTSLGYTKRFPSEFRGMDNFFDVYLMIKEASIHSSGTVTFPKHKLRLKDEEGKLSRQFNMSVFSKEQSVANIRFNQPNQARYEMGLRQAYKSLFSKLHLLTDMSYQTGADKEVFAAVIKSFSRTIQCYLQWAPGENEPADHVLEEVRRCIDKAADPDNRTQFQIKEGSIQGAENPISIVMIEPLPLGIVY